VNEAKANSVSTHDEGGFFQSSIVNRQSSILGAGAAMVWRRQSVLWWIFVVNFALAFMGTRPFAAEISPVLDHSLQAQAFVHGFSPILLSELLMEAKGTSAATAASVFFTVTFFVFMLFVEGGVLETYWLDRPPAKGEFFEASGRFFWRFVRLLVVLSVALIPVGIVYRLVSRLSDALHERTANPMPGVWAEFVGLLLVLFLMQAARLWFDMAQVRAVAEDERAVRRALRWSLKMTWGNFRSLYWIYLRISVVAWLAIALLLAVWVRWVRPEWVGTSFVITQLMALVWLGTRLWQRASETLWYQQHLALLIPPRTSIASVASSPAFEGSTTVS
jgi:hypothetical protein